MEKISIVGDSASGKTYLARALSSRLNLPVYDLENVDWKHKYSAKRDSGEHERLLNMMSAQNGIFTGVPNGWNNELLLSADKILVLDIPSSIRALRILKRYCMRKLSGSPTERFIALLRNIDNALMRPSPTTGFMRQITREHADKVTFINSKNELREYIAKAR